MGSTKKSGPEITEIKITKWSADYSIGILRISLGIIFLWFGLMKFFPNLSAVEEIASETVEKISFGLIPENVAIYFLATLETLIGVGLLFRLFLKITLILLFFQMIGTLMPLIIFPEKSFIYFPIAPTLEGAYSIKNLVLIAAAFVILATLRGGGLIADPKITQQAKKKEEEKLDEMEGEM